MKKLAKYLFYIVCAFFSAFSLQSCMDFDEPGAELTDGQQQDDDVVYRGEVDRIDYRKEITEEGFAEAENIIGARMGQLVTAQYCMRGGKDGNPPGSHAYQYQFTMAVDNYAGYATLPQNFDGRIRSTYYINTQFNSGPDGAYLTAKNQLVPLMNHPQIDSIPEIKALALLLYNYASQELVDLYGAFPYINYKENQEDHPFTYNSMPEIYNTIVDNIDTITTCFNHYTERPEWYKRRVSAIMNRRDKITIDKSFDTWTRFANSLKLRMAMHIVKVDPEKAQKWAEEAIAGGVIEDRLQEVRLDPMYEGFSHPLTEISQTWNDTRLNASFESLLMSLKHPYADYLFLKNEHPIVNNNDPTKVLPANSRLVGLRAGILMNPGQDIRSNPRVAYSRLIADETLVLAPVYFMKLSEVDFLRAEGALRGWQMGGSAQMFYNRGIDNAAIENRDMPSVYEDNLAEYKAVDSPINYVYEDPMDEANNLPSITKIGVRWNEGDDRETKLEKIITQKYIAGFPYSFEAWTDLRRTGYPKIFPVLNASDGDGSLMPGDLIRRMPFPGDTDSAIQDINDTGLDALGGSDKQGTRVWWDVAERGNF